MNALSLSRSLPAVAARPARAPLAATPAAPLTSAETTRIADAFPARPQVAQTLYGADRSVQQAAPLGSRLDLSA